MEVSTGKEDSTPHLFFETRLNVPEATQWLEHLVFGSDKKSDPYHLQAMHQKHEKLYSELDFPAFSIDSEKRDIRIVFPSMDMLQAFLDSMANSADPKLCDISHDVVGRFNEEIQRKFGHTGREP